jgi:excisionase family DNA binding protein
MNLQTLKATTALPSPGKVMTVTETDPLLTNEQLAEMLGISMQKIYALRSSGEGPKALKLGHKLVRYRLSDVEAWLKSKESACTAEDAA